LDTIKNKRAARSSNMYDGRTILHLAAAENNLKLCKYIVGLGNIDINSLMKTSTVIFMISVEFEFYFYFLYFFFLKEFLHDTLRCGQVEEGD
jgi:hypothetical protein